MTDITISFSEEQIRAIMSQFNESLSIISRLDWLIMVDNLVDKISLELGGNYSPQTFSASEVISLVKDTLERELSYDNYTKTACKHLGQ